MDVIINFDKIIALMELPPDILAFKLFAYFGWIPIFLFLLWGVWQLWIYYIEGDYAAKREFVLLAIDIPTGNEQTPRAVEHMFAHLHGAHGSINLIEWYWQGRRQESFSMEIVSIEGYTQYLIRGNVKYRDLMEAAIYAQYPEAEITEVNDYTEGFPDRFPDDKYNMAGGEYILVQHELYPIRTYLDFEHQFSGDFIDPAAAMIELFSSLKKGEQCWYQIIITPTNTDWEKAGADEIAKIMGEEVAGKKGLVDWITDGLIKLIAAFGEFIIPSGEESKDKEKDMFNMFLLKPEQKKKTEGIQQKISKIGFETKIRFIYLAEKEVFNGVRANSFTGVMKQYSMQDLNAIKPDTDMTYTSTSYYWKESRKNKRRTNAIQAYKARSNWLGRLPSVLNIEELATIWHFPVETAVKAPMLQKVPSRKTEAPSYLPVEGSVSDLASEIAPGAEAEISDEEKREIFSDKKTEAAKTATAVKPAGPPANLPIG